MSLIDFNIAFKYMNNNYNNGMNYFAYSTPTYYSNLDIFTSYNQLYGKSSKSSESSSYYYGQKLAEKYGSSLTKKEDITKKPSGYEDYLNKKYAPSLGLDGYNAEKGAKLGSIAAKNSVGFTGYCARYAKRDIQEAGLGTYQSGHGYQCDDILRENPNFKEIKLTNGMTLEDLPAGCVLVYERGVAGYSSEYGHIEITDGKGNAYSDGKTRNIRPGAKIFMPV